MLVSHMLEAGCFLLVLVIAKRLPNSREIGLKKFRRGEKVVGKEQPGEKQEKAFVILDK